MNRGPRNASLLAQISKSNPFLERAQAFFAVGNAYDRDVEAIAEDRRWSAEGKGERVKARRQEALDKLAELQKPITGYHEESERMRAGMKKPTYDKADSLDRWKLRDRSEKMNFGQRSMRMKSDKVFRDSVLEFAPWVSGFNESEPNELALYQEAKAEQERDLNGELMTALKARADTESEIMMVANIVRNDVQGDGAYRAEIQATRDAYVAAATA